MSAAPAALGPLGRYRTRGWWARTPITLRLGASILAVHLLFAVAGPFCVPYGYVQMGAGLPLSGLSWQHPFGIDQLGRDIFSRVAYGGHIVILLALSGTLLGLLSGATVGLWSGYIGGWVDGLVQRLVEVLISIPFLILALIGISAAGPELTGDPLLVVLVVALVYAPRIARMARAATLDIVSRDYVTAARLRGEGAWSVMVRELLPNVSGVLLVEFALRAGYAPVLIGSLGFLGFGMRPPTPEWGLMISENRVLLLVTPSAVLAPGLTLASLVVGLNLFTDGLARLVGRTASRVT